MAGLDMIYKSKNRYKRSDFFLQFFSAFVVAINKIDLYLC